MIVKQLLSVQQWVSAACKMPLHSTAHSSVEPGGAHSSHWIPNSNYVQLNIFNKKYFQFNKWFFQNETHENQVDWFDLIEFWNNFQDSQIR